MNLLQQIERDQLAKLVANRTTPDFRAGDTLKISVKVVEGERTRLQMFEGVCIARKNAGINSAFTVRKISYGEGVERVFPLYSPNVAAIEVLRRGDVRRGKLYYLRGRTGKKARITELETWATEREAALAEVAAQPAGATDQPKKEKKEKKAKPSAKAKK